MTIESFTAEKFESVLSDAGLKFDCLGYISGEKSYYVSLDSQSGIRIRSSIHHDGQSATVGQDSIRCWLVGPGAKSLIGKETLDEERWTTRQPGWEKRLVEKIDQLRFVRSKLGNCSKCGAPNLIARSHSQKNPGRIYVACSNFNCKGWSRWVGDLDEFEQQPAMALSFSGASKSDSQSIETKENDLLVPLNDKATGLSFLSDAAPVEMPKESVGESVAKPFTPSKYQEAIRDFVLNRTQALRVEAYAGSGKTSTNAFVCRAIDKSRGNVKMMVFSKANQLDMQAKIPDWIPATTTHSAGFADIRHVYRNVKVDERKTLNLFKSAFEHDYELREQYPAVAKLVSLCKNTLSEPTNENLDELCERYDVNLNGSRDEVFDAVGLMLKQSAEQTNIVDFDDMLWFPASGKVGVGKCDLLFVDEYQDNNRAQEQYYLKTGARIIFVGDAKQAIYGFRGAMIGAMDRMQSKLQAERLPLPISYRCAKSIIALAQTIVPQIQAREDAPEGIVGDGSLSSVKAGDMVLCRNNAPLVKPCFELIRNGVKATIKGRDIGTNLVNLIHKVEKKNPSYSFLQLLANVQDYVDEQSAKLTAQHKESQAASLQDQGETIVALSEACHSLADLENCVKTIFSEEVAGVVFSTIHKAKGLESDRVFVLKPELLNPQKYDTKSWQLDQLSNLTYVCYTRAKNELRFVRGG